MKSEKASKQKKQRPKKKNKKKWLIIGILLGAFISVFILFFFIPVTGFTEHEKVILINTSDINKEAFLSKLQKDSVLTSTFLFKQSANLLQLWSSLEPGKYKIKKHTGLFPLLLKFKRRDQLTNKVTIQKIRTRQQLAELIGKKLECDPATFLSYINNIDSLKKNELNPNTVISIILPDTYYYGWDATPEEILVKFKKEHERFWDQKRKEKAKALGLSPLEVTTLASIVEEETTIQEDKSLIAGVYLNRIRKGMQLGACPTIKYALQDFTLKRILNEHILQAGTSPYNTYKIKGLPPGPICTPSRETIDATLEAGDSEYLFFCAMANSGGRHAFAKTYEEHQENARKYQKWLDEKKIR